MPDRAVLSRRVHGLEDQQQGVAVRRVEQLLLRAQLRDVVFQQLFILLFRAVHGRDLGRPLFQVDLLAFRHAKIV